MGRIPRNGQRRSAPLRYSVGVDGEGQGRKAHRYVMLCYSDASGDRAGWVEDKQGLSTARCLDFLLSIPARARAFSFVFNYDLTMLLRDVPDRELYLLFRPELRVRPMHPDWGPAPVAYFPDPNDHTEGYSLNLQGTKFSVRRTRSAADKHPRSRTVWDVFKFFQCAFVSALEKWKVGDDAARARMLAMKDQRAEFDKLPLSEIRPYCLSECRDMATLADRLIAAHKDAGFELDKFYGAGTTGGLILKELGIGEHKRGVPPAMQEPVMCAFFGGRFEHSIFGPVEEPVDGWDIASAYPYQIYRLPCLNHARWSYTRSRRRFETARHALVRYRLGRAPRGLAWGPFPFREVDGSIVYPTESRGGWVWREEYLAGEKLFPHVGFVGAWVLESDCRCHPFKRIAEHYKQRLAWGKDGKGIVLKLGCNSVNGKLCQSIGGKPPYQCFAWSGMVMSGTRAQLLELLALHKRSSGLLAMATDGIYTRERITPPLPEDTGTFDALDVDSGKPKPLGSWEKKSFPKGMFFIRPGLYFPIDAKEKAELKEMRGRGIGKKDMLRVSKLASRAYAKGETSIVLPSHDRFWGAKSTIGRVSRGDPMHGYDWEYRRMVEYGQWTKRPVALDFNPMPKRARIGADGQTLVLRKVAGKSAPYDARIVSPEGLRERAARDEDLEQPNGGEGVLDNLIHYTDE